LFEEVKEFKEVIEFEEFKEFKEVIEFKAKCPIAEYLYCCPVKLIMWSKTG